MSEDSLKSLIYRVAANQPESGLTAMQFWTALARLSTNPAVLNAALQSDSYTTTKPNPQDTAKPIPIE